MPKSMMDMMGGMGGETSEPESDLGEEAVHLKRMFAAQRAGDMAGAAKAFKRAVQACVEGGYDEEAAPEDDDDTGY